MVSSAGASSAAVTQRRTFGRVMRSCRRASGYWTDRLSLFFADIFDGSRFDQMGDVGVGFLGALVGVDDARDQRMAHHVLAAELREGDAAHVAQHLDSVDQATLLRLVQVDLRNVAGDDGLAAEADSRRNIFICST